MTNSVLTRFTALIIQDLRLAYRQRAEFLQPILFFLLMVVLFPLAITPDATILRGIASGLIWLSVFFAVNLSLHRLFRSDFDEGVLEQYVLSPLPLTGIIGAKLIAHWLMLVAPLILLMPITGMLFHFNSNTLWILIFSLLLGVASLVLVGALGSALTLHINQGALLLPLLVMPLSVPVLIFSSSAVAHAMLNLTASSELAFLAALFILSALFMPWACAVIIRLMVG